jgi:hypothetical protein
MLGAILTGVFASSAINPIFHNASGGVLASGWLEGNARQMLNQAAGVAVACLLAGVGTFLLLKLVDATVGLRVSEEHEAQGLDVTQHGEEGYVWEPVLAVATPLPAPLAPALPLRLSVSPHRNLVATPMVEPELAGINPLARRQPGTGLSRRRLGRRPRAPRPLTRVNGREFQTEADRIAPDPLHWL